MKLAYEQIVDFLSSAPTPERILKYKAPPKAQARVTQLIDKKKNTTLNTEEEEELTSYLHLEHILRMAKAKAAIRLKKGK